MSIPDWDHEGWLRQAIALADLCPPSDKAFAVGAILVSGDGRVLATGYSRELSGSHHAEEVVLEKLGGDTPLAGAVLYTSLEPCSIRLSGKPSCCRRILAAGIATVVFAAREPPTFVDGQGAERLAAAGVSVVEVPALAPLVQAQNAAVWR